MFPEEVTAPENVPVVAFTDPPLTFVAVADVSAAPAVAALPDMPILYVPDRRAAGRTPAVALLASSAVTGMVMLAAPLKDVAVPVAPPDMPMVRAVASFVAVPALPDMAMP